MLAVDVYELSVDLAPGVRDVEFVAALDRYHAALWREFPDPQRVTGQERF
jgi:hypothetical protein